ncbi:ATP-grasp domain-containing protein [candidate division NPL-UPA2 bacterium Unc8]|uniref:ATP-grasp domain-containing protein n=1 Tax=candidate division NPL-UPA2 bacterium Unc8 TaxID=1980939 RepID=A0A399FWG5_UNCN2|nr:2-oxoglutarate carboxylase small subunit [Bacillota bacterium]MBT9137997.1 2-oxoglutarate carboxylase small subunit [Bacillota bacterium]MBT9146614.1 2-oxoglutarate carboxylase small subunit [Bacillota bacterium]RII00765.1 MAG: ATP-grasp domain-containing protein [candidate division NPL-UPA2 bacterium Unc8]
MMISSVLVANRGEIARRVIRTIKRLKIKTIAVYSDIDENTLFANDADEKVSLGGKTPLESYLNIEKIIKVAVDKKCEAIHPGYGFLSENSDFIRACENENIIFIGPKASSVAVMGDKQRARETAKKLGVPIISGSGILKNLKEAEEVCKELSFPVILKASAGGGGIGMKKVETEGELRQAYEQTSNRARAAFGDGRVYIEKYLEEPHHIEIQVLRDKFGNVLTFYERECSVQRRHQKIIEESPSTFVPEELRHNLREAAKKLVNGIDYLNAATIEFMVDKYRNFYFLEANTRLQVEHPITEEISGVDLVEFQLEIASGKPIPLLEENLKVSGWAIESRIYAEDPEKFYPSPGTIAEYSEPQGEGIRVDSGTRGGDVISSFYDPLIAKLVTFGEDRTIAIERMLFALENYSITGIKTNIPFLTKAYSSKLFSNGGYDTHFIEKLNQIEEEIR